MSTLKLNPRHVVTVLEVSGRFSIGESGGELHSAVQKALKEGAITLILDLQHVGYMDSTGVGELVGAQKLARSHGAQFKLLNPNPRVADLLQITGLASTMDIYTDEAEAAFTFKR
jgi:anti-sigma B factor antagonist